MVCSVYCYLVYVMFVASLFSCRCVLVFVFVFVCLRFFFVCCVVLLRVDRVFVFSLCSRVCSSYVAFVSL